jgi:site-specific recombinase XerD
MPRPRKLIPTYTLHKQSGRGRLIWTDTAHHGKERVIPLGPNARSVLVRFLAGRVLEPDEPIFSPRRAREEHFARLRENRQSKVQPSQVSRKKANAKRQPGEQYTPQALSHTVGAAAIKAKVTHWHPYQLRHSYATKVRRQHGSLRPMAQREPGVSRPDPLK